MKPTNKRQIKSYIRHFCGSIAGECILAMSMIKDADKATLEKAIVEVADLQEASLRVVSVSFDKSERDFESAAAYRKARRTYYKTAYARLLTEFDEKLNAIVSLINSALPKEK